MPLPFPKPFFDALVREGCHGKARVGDAKAAFFLTHHGRRRVDGLTFGLGGSERPCFLNAVLQDQPVNITHAVH